MFHLFLEFDFRRDAFTCHSKLDRDTLCRATLPFLFGISFILSQDEFPRFTVR